MRTRLAAFSLSIYVFVWLQGLSAIPDVSHAALSTGPDEAVLSSSPPNNTTTIDEDELYAALNNIHHRRSSTGDLVKTSLVNTNTTATNSLALSQRRKQSVSSSSPSSSESSSSSSSAVSSRSGSASNLSHASSINNAIASTRKSQIDLDSASAAPQSQRLLLSFKCPLSEEKEVEWSTLLVNSCLYVDVPNGVLPEGSRDSFVSLLEFAEERLDCAKVYVCFARARTDRQALMRVFMFLGFSVVPPNDQSVPHGDDLISMVYNIE